MRAIRPRTNPNPIPKPLHKPPTSRRSSLGLDRIRGVSVEQLLRATPHDIHTLNTYLRSWRVPSFNQHSLLLRALTHPSFSNWAERVTNAPKRSLGANTLELLGDRVLGTAIAMRVHEWQKVNQIEEMPEMEQWASRHGAVSIVKSLVGNRGFAYAAKECGIEKLSRWERGIEKKAYRARVENGIDKVSGMMVNGEVNGLANLFEAVTGALYLGGGWEGVEGFVGESVFRNVKEIQRENRGVEEWSGVLQSVLSRWYECEENEVVVRVMDWGERDGEFWAGVWGGRNGKEELLGVGSQFAVETARIAAIKVAIDRLTGEKEEREIQGGEEVEMGGRKVRIEGGRWADEGVYGKLVEDLDRMGIAEGRMLREVAERSGLRERVGAAYGSKKGKEDLRWMGSRRGRGNLGRNEMCEKVVGECLEIGSEIEKGILGGKYERTSGGIKESEQVVKAVEDVINELEGVGRWWQYRELRSLQCVGHNVYRLWSVQRSMTEVSQDRQQVVKVCERRMRVMKEMEAGIVGDGLQGLETIGVRKGLAALGACAKSCGVETALAWLSGGEVRGGVVHKVERLVE